MIISHQHKYIFFAVPKTATHSIREALRLTKSDQDWEQQVLFGKQAIPIPEISAIAHGHISALQIKSALPKEQWSGYYKFGFVRNPYDRFISICAFLNRQNAGYPGNELSWMKQAIRRKPFLNRVLVRPQSEQLIGIDGKIALDFVGRYESLQKSLDNILSHLGLELVELKVRNKSNHASYQTYYDDELKNWVTMFYQEDIKRFGYTF